MKAVTAITFNFQSRLRLNVKLWNIPKDCFYTTRFSKRFTSICDAFKKIGIVNLTKLGFAQAPLVASYIETSNLF